MELSLYLLVVITLLIFAFGAIILAAIDELKTSVEANTVATNAAVAKINASSLDPQITAIKAEVDANTTALNNAVNFPTPTP